MSENWTILNIFANFLGIIFYYIVLIIICTPGIVTLCQPELGSYIAFISTNVVFWILMILSPILSIIIDISLSQVFFIANPNPINEIRSRLKDDSFKKHFVKIASRFTNYNDPEIKQIDTQLQEILKKYQILIILKIVLR